MCRASAEELREFKAPALGGFATIDATWVSLVMLASGVFWKHNGVHLSAQVWTNALIC